MDGLSTVGGLYSPSSGIIDAHDLTLSLESNLQNLGVIVSNKSFVKGIETSFKDGYELLIESPKGAFLIACSIVINCAGLYATNVAKSISGMRAELIPKIYYAKGHYFSLSGSHPFKHHLKFKFNFSFKFNVPV